MERGQFLRPLIATILLALLTLPFGSTYLFLEYEKSKAKAQAKIILATDSDTTQMLWLKFTKNQLENELRWEHSKEFEYKGQMYDVAQKKQKGDTTYLYVYWDKMETLVNQKLKKLIALGMGGEADSQDDAQLIVSLFKAVYTCPDHFNPAPPSFPDYKLDFFYIEAYDFVWHTTDAPPPRFLG